MPRVDTKPHYFPLPLGWFVPFLMLVPMFFCESSERGLARRGSY